MQLQTCRVQMVRGGTDDEGATTEILMVGWRTACQRSNRIKRKQTARRGTVGGITTGDGTATTTTTTTRESMVTMGAIGVHCHQRPVPHQKARGGTGSGELKWRQALLGRRG